MLRVITLFLALGFVISCAHNHETAQTDAAADSSCAVGDCSKNLNKLAAPAEETTAPAAPKDKAKSKKKSKK